MALDEDGNYYQQFQSTRLREARRTVIAVGALQAWFQSTRLREARPLDQGALTGGLIVSIHAPA